MLTIGFKLDFVQRCLYGWVADSGLGGYYLKAKNHFTKLSPLPTNITYLV